MYIITMDVCIRLGILTKGNLSFYTNKSDCAHSGEKYSSEDLKTKVIYVVGQWIYTVLMILPAPLFFYFR